MAKSRINISTMANIHICFIMKNRCELKQMCHSTTHRCKGNDGGILKCCKYQLCVNTKLSLDGEEILIQWFFVVVVVHSLPCYLQIRPHVNWVSSKTTVAAMQ